MSVNLLNQIYNNGKAIPLKYDKLAGGVSITKTLRINSLLLPIKDDPNINVMTLNQAFLLKIVKIKLQKRQQDANMPKELVLGFSVAKLFSPRLMLSKR